MAVSLRQRVEVLEEVVSELTTLPPRVERIEKALNEFRDEVRQEFVLVRSEIKREINGVSEASQRQTDQQLKMVHEDLVQRIETSEEDTRRQMRMLQQDLVERIKTIGQSKLPNVNDRL